MDMRSRVAPIQSAQQCLQAVKYIGTDKKKIKELVHIFVTEGDDIARPASWVLSKIAEAHPDLLYPHLHDIISRLERPVVHNGIKRHVLKILEICSVPEDEEGVVMNICFDVLSDVKEAVAIKVFAMSVLASLAKKYPDIKHELITILQNTLSLEATPGFKSRANKVIRALTK
jgi:hypothetical protein